MANLVARMELSKRSVPVARPCFDAEEERLLLEVLRSRWVTQGPRVEEFEKRFAEAVGARHAVAVSSCTTGLFLAFHALGIGPGDEVVVPSLSFIATANAVIHAGAAPVFADVEPRSFNLDPEAVAAAIGPRTRAILVVHQLGLPADLARIEKIARERGLALIEDSACAVGSRLAGRPIGSSDHVGCFSFHARKVLVTGEGGMLVTPDGELAARLRRLRHQGMSISDLDRHRSARPMIEEYPEVGYNFRLSDLQAAIGIAQLAKLDAFLARRRLLAARYHQALAAFPELEAPFTPEGTEPNFQSYIIRIRGADAERRNRVIEELQRRGVASRRGLMASHLEPCHRDARRAGPLPETNLAAAQTLLLPIFHELSEADQDYVTACLREALDA
ncbi:MAG: DegT/DnrJ/EryC1/StrS family aminotransferase [Candidatus Limnocylindria bacterium]